jgi:hypothetical protein
MAELDVTKKLSVYHLLYRINLSFSNIVQRCGELEATRVFRPKFLRLFRSFAQELQSEINQELLLPMHELELDDWFRHGKVRQAWEKYLKDPDDVFIEAKERREQLLKQGKKPPQRKHSAIGHQQSAKSGVDKSKGA